MVASLVTAFVVAGLVGLATDELILKPFRASGFITTAIGSIALTIALENCVRFAFGNELRGYDLPIRRDWVWGGLHVGPQQVQNLVIAAIAMAPAVRLPVLHAHRQGHARGGRQSHAGRHQGHQCRHGGAAGVVRRPWGSPGSAAC